VISPDIMMALDRQSPCDVRSHPLALRGSKPQPSRVQAVRQNTAEHFGVSPCCYSDVVAPARSCSFRTMSKRYREALVGKLEASGVIRTPLVRDAFLRVHRETFIPSVAEEQGIAAVYQDEAFPIKTDVHGDAISSSSQPGIMAAMLEELQVSPGQRVLEIGAGTGYNAAILSRLAGRTGHVTSVEIDPGVARQAGRAVAAAGQRATVVARDGRSGWEPNAPYHRMILTASSLDVPAALLTQLEEGGQLVMPLRLSDAVPFRQIVVTFKRIGRSLRSISVIHGGFMRMRARSDDPSLPWPVSEIVETRDGTRHVLASLSGSTWGHLSPDQRSRLLALMLSDPRYRGIGIRATGRSQWGLEAFLALAAPEERLVGCARADLEHLQFFSTSLPGVMGDPAKPSLAHLGGNKTLSRIEAYGTRDADRLLGRLVEEWRRRRRPDVTRLGVEVVFGPQTREAWRSKRRGSSTLLFDWR
jgi:protein-L-isoaspartate(D-aspartate) O-methyltransferase